MTRRVWRLFAAALITPALLSAPAALAQEATAGAGARPFPLLSYCDRVIPRRNAPGYSDDAAVLRQNAIDILTDTFIANATWARTLASAADESVINAGPVSSGGIILRAPVRHAEVGRVVSDVVGIPVLRERFVVLSAGTEVWKSHHVVDHRCRRDDVQLWCGPRRPETEFRYELQCFMPRESDWLGIAQLRGNEYFPFGFVKYIEDAEHLGVTPAETISVPAMEIRLAFQRWRGETAELSAYVWIEGAEERDNETAIFDIADMRYDERGAIVSLWGGEFLLRRGTERESAIVEILSPIAGYDPNWQTARMRDRATRRVDEELTRRAEREARRR